jgi:DNA-binding NtrC family response regulator
MIGLPIVLPPLRDRGSDILILAKHFADAFVRTNKMNPVLISKSAKDKLLKYHYPGNVRELKAVMDLAVVMCENNEITSSDITFNSLGREDIIVMEEKSLRVHICDIIRFYLNNNNNDVIATAKALDIGKSTIYKMIKEGEREP